MSGQWDNRLPLQSYKRLQKTAYFCHWYSIYEPLHLFWHLTKLFRGLCNTKNGGDKEGLNLAQCEVFGGVMNQNLEIKCHHHANHCFFFQEKIKCTHLGKSCEMPKYTVKENIFLSLKTLFNWNQMYWSRLHVLRVLGRIVILSGCSLHDLLFASNAPLQKLCNMWSLYFLIAS